MEKFGKKYIKMKKIVIILKYLIMVEFVIKILKLNIILNVIKKDINQLLLIKIK